MDEDKGKLTKAMARLVACRQQLAEQRAQLQKSASAHLDRVNEEISVGSAHLERDPNVLTYRYVRRAVTDGQRLRGLALRAEGDRATSER